MPPCVRRLAVQVHASAVGPSALGSQGARKPGPAGSSKKSVRIPGVLHLPQLRGGLTEKLWSSGLCRPLRMLSVSSSQGTSQGSRVQPTDSVSDSSFLSFCLYVFLSVSVSSFSSLSLSVFLSESLRKKC